MAGSVSDKSKPSDQEVLKRFHRWALTLTHKEAGEFWDDVSWLQSFALSTVGPSAGTIHSMTGECPTCGHSAHSSATEPNIREAAMKVLRRYVWKVQNPAAPLAGTASLDAAMVELRNAFLRAGEQDGFENSASTDGEVAK